MVQEAWQIACNVSKSVVCPQPMEINAILLPYDRTWTTAEAFDGEGSQRNL